jgi:glycerol-3-phosphate dehydrogenase
MSDRRPMEISTAQPTKTRSAAAARAIALAEIDVLIIGAGINGCATFRDLCLNGVTCLLVDAEDFGAGASSASTRIAHGGLRYLENGEWRLVAEATVERNRLLQNAPHYVTPLLITIPSFSRFGGIMASIGKLVRVHRPMRSRGLVLIKIGLSIYDWLGRKQGSLPRHRMSSRAQAHRLLPKLHPGVVGIASYYDARIAHTERLAFELVDDGLKANPESAALNHCRVIGVAGSVVELKDLLAGTSFSVRPKIVINAAGAWIDAVNGRFGRNDRLIGGTKGSHIMIESPALLRALDGRCFSYDDGTGRMCVAYPVGTLVMLGSSDIRVEDPDAVICDETEIAYFLSAIRLIFPMVDVDRTMIRYRFSGVRPLPFQEGKDTVNISRDHSIQMSPPQAGRIFPILSLIGGKWTTFRAFAEQVTDRVLDALQRSRVVSTRALPIGGGRSYPMTEDARRHWIAEATTALPIGVERMETLLTRYGTTARDVAAFCLLEADAPLAAAPDYTKREIRYLIRFELVATLEDLIYRRTMMAMEGRLSFGLLVELATIIAGDASTSATADCLRPAITRLRRESGVDFSAQFDAFDARQMAVATS